MACSLHGSARITPRVRSELQASQETTGVLAKRYGLSRATVIKWRNRTTTNDTRMGPRSPRSTVLTETEEAMVVEFRRSIAAIGRCAGLSAQQHSEPVPVKLASLSGTAWHLPVAQER